MDLSNMRSTSPPVKNIDKKFEDDDEGHEDYTTPSPVISDAVTRPLNKTRAALFGPHIHPAMNRDENKYISRFLSLEEQNISRVLSKEEPNNSRFLSMEEPHNSRFLSKEEPHNSRVLSMEEPHNSRFLSKEELPLVKPIIILADYSKKEESLHDDDNRSIHSIHTDSSYSSNSSHSSSRFIHNDSLLDDDSDKSMQDLLEMSGGGSAANTMTSLIHYMFAQFPIIRELTNLHQPTTGRH